MYSFHNKPYSIHPYTYIHLYSSALVCIFLPIVAYAHLLHAADYIHQNSRFLRSPGVFTSSSTQLLFMHITRLHAYQKLKFMYKHVGQFTGGLWLLIWPLTPCVCVSVSQVYTGMVCAS